MFSWRWESGSSPATPAPPETKDLEPCQSIKMGPSEKFNPSSIQTRFVKSQNGDINDADCIIFHMHFLNKERRQFRIEGDTQMWHPLCNAGYGFKTKSCSPTETKAINDWRSEHPSDSRSPFLTPPLRRLLNAATRKVAPSATWQRSSWNEGSTSRSQSSNGIWRPQQLILLGFSFAKSSCQRSWRY